MRNQINRLHTTRQRQAIFLFLLGFAGGVFLFLWNHDEVRNDKTYFVETILWRMGNYEIDTGTYFNFLIQKRLFVWVLLTICAMTLLGMWFIRMFFVWNGICFGGILSMYLYWYGSKGIVYVFFLIFPQIICYVPAYLGLCYLLTQLYEKIYHSLSNGYYSSRNDVRWKGIQKTGLYFLLLLVAIIGVFFESYVNPFVVKKIVSFF